MRATIIFIRDAGLCLPLVATLVLAGGTHAVASSDQVRNAHAKQGCVRGKFKDYYLQGQAGDPPASYKGRVFKLSQNYPNKLPPKENYPWLAVKFKHGGPVNPKAYLKALLKYGLEGNVKVDFYVEDNKVRHWYAMPWMDWNTEVAADWPGTDGREFVHGLTHEFDSGPGVLSTLQKTFVQTWSGAYYNDRAAFGIGQVYCDPDSPDPAALNPDPHGLNNFADGSYIIKLLFSGVTEQQLPIIKNTLMWQADTFVDPSPRYRNQGPISRYARAIQPVRLLQIDVAIRDDRSPTGWLFGTFSYDGTQPGKTPWDRMVPLGLQWGNNPHMTYSDTCSAIGKCKRKKLTEQWINEPAAKRLTTPPLSVDHLGFAGRLAGPVDNPNAACLACHQTAGFPPVAIMPEFSSLSSVLGLDDAKNVADNQSFRMNFYKNVVSGATFSDSQLYSSDFSLQLSMSLNNFTALRCSVNVAKKPKICSVLDKWANAMRTYIGNVMTFGTPGPDGAPVPAGN